NKTTITNTLPGLNIIADSPGLGAYTNNSVIWAEHGHRYCMFNAPDTWSVTNSHLPMGYFISRLAASKSANEGQVYTTMDALDTLVKSPDSYYTAPEGEEGAVFNDVFIRALFDAFALVWAGYWPWDTFTMDGLDNYTNSPSIDHVGDVFDGIYSNWPSRMDIVHQYEAVWNELGDLSSAAVLLFEMPDRIKSDYPFTPRIVLFGHTHNAALSCYYDTNTSIYANTGTWIDGKPRSWVEIEIDNTNGSNSYTVSLWFEGESSARQTATLDDSGIESVEDGSSGMKARDFDGDGKTDMAVYHEESGCWHVVLSDSWTLSQFKFGETGYTPVPGDYDGDGKTDVAVYQDASGYWFILSSSTWELTQQKLGDTGYTPVPGDYDGDGKTDMAVYHEESGYWHILLSGSGYSLYYEQLGGPGYAPLTR
ncbi:FG-GAP repeat domain-containing protein, partial [Verrucomicrobiota bacterium]